MLTQELQTPRPPAILNAIIRACYRIAYRLWKLYLRIRKRETFGAQVAVRCRSNVLLIKSSYRGFYSFPGGYLNQGEMAVDCASRELKEEAGVDIPSTMLRPAFSTTYQCGGHLGHDEFYELSVDAEPMVSIDNREIIFAEFIDMSDALSLPLDGQVRRYIMQNLS